MCMDVGPEGFMTPKRPDRGNEGDLGMVVAGYESGGVVCYEATVVVKIMS
jgi:hypothetical protein